MSNNTNNSAYQSSLDSILEKLQDISSATFSSFLIIHLASPIVAAFVSPARAEQIASNIQLAGRVVYQDSIGRESLMVWTSLGTHLLVGFIRRITRINRQRAIRASLERSARLAAEFEHARTPSTSSSSYPRTWTTTTRREPKIRTVNWLKSYLPKTTHAISAYIGLPLLLDHIFMHRLRPKTNLSYQFVSYYLNQKPWISNLKYLILVGSISFHSLSGLHHLWSKYVSKRGRKPIGHSSSSTSVRLAWLGVVGSVGLGIRKISHEQVTSWLARRYQPLI